MKAPSADLLRMLRRANSARPPSLGSSRYVRCASTHSYTSQWKRSKNPRTHPPGRRDELEQYFEDLVSRPAAKTAPASRTSPAAPPAEPLPETDREETLAKARIVFGSKLAGPGDRRRHLDSESTRVAGVLVPPRPTEPDNCCMSGCVNCVWDQYRDELEEWATQSAKAREAVEADRGEEQGTGAKRRKGPTPMPGHVANSMDDDGGGSEANWNSGLELTGRKGDLFEGIPVGIREFMRQEKRLKEKKRDRNAS